MTRFPDFYDRSFDADTGTDDLKCRECGFTVTHDHDEVPPASTLVNCLECGLPSRIPALPSQAGMVEPVDPPPQDERS